MTFIKIQKLVRDNSGKIIRDSATIIDTEYVKSGLKTIINILLEKNLEMYFI